MKRLTTVALSIIGISGFLALAFYHMKKAGPTPFADGKIDLHYYYLPLFTFAKSSILAGEFPLWNPYQALGGPFFAKAPLGLLYPFNWFMLIMEVRYGMLLVQALDVVIGMVGTLLYMRYLKLDWPAVVLGTALSGYLILAQTFNLALGSTYCWLPIIVWMTHRLVDKPGFGGCVTLAASLAFSFLGGGHQIFYYMCLLVFVYFFFLVLSFRPRYDVKAIMLRVSLFGFAFLLLIGLVSVQLLPTLELSLLSTRNVTEKVYLEGDPSVRDFSLAHMVAAFVSQDQNLIYFGSSLFLVPFALGSRRHRQTVIPLLASLAYSIIFVLSKKSPALGFLGDVPFADSFRVQAKMLEVGHFMIALLSGIGLSVFLQKGSPKLWDRQTRNLDWFWIFILLCIIGISYQVFLPVVRLLSNHMGYFIILLPGFAAACALFLHSTSLPRLLKRLGAGALALLAVLSFVIHKDLTSPFIYHMLLLPGMVLVVAFLLHSSSYPHSTRRVVLWITLFLVLLDVASFRYVRRTAPAITLTKNSKFLFDRQVGWAQDHGGFNRVLIVPGKPLEKFKAKRASMFRFYNIADYEPFTLSRWGRYIQSMVGREEFQRTWWPFCGLVSDFSDEFLEQPGMAGVTSLRYFLVNESDRNKMPLDQQRAWELNFTSEGEPKFSVYENRFALPRTYLVNEYLITENEEETLRALREHVEKLSHLVVLENGAPSFASAPGSKSSGRTEILRYGLNKVELKVEASEPSLVVLTDAYYPGWIAFVDGTEKPVWRANSLFRAVEVPQGNHTVILEYRPASLRWGAVISLGSLLLIIVGLFAERYVGRKLTGTGVPR